MNKVILLISACFLVSLASYAQDDEKEAIKNVIQKAYVDGLQNLEDISETEKGFHPGFNLLGVRNNMLTKFPIYSWIESAKFRKKEKKKELPITTCDYTMIDITGNAAIAKIDLHREGKHIFTDYLSLYKFEEGWRIVSKIYYRIPEDKN